ncbi:MAG TPA: ABC transporter ATP-binding protein [bacterium]|nr:ABC transporter ATP-binding protein [bacterium]
MNKIILSAECITKNYYVGNTVLEVLKGVDLDLMEGQIIAIIGESGAGKSTLLHLLGFLDRPTSGQLKFNAENLNEKTEIELAQFRNNQIGFIFQFHHLLPEFNAFENVLMPALIARKNSSDIIRRVEYLLDRVGLSKRLKHRPGELSGGELQRVAVARALINEPAIVLADEPSGNLDHRNSEMLHDLIWNLARENNYSFVIVTHDLSLAKKADRVMLLNDGTIEDIESERLNELLLI